MRTSRFYCHSKRSYVECFAPLACNHDCTFWQSKEIKEVAHRPIFSLLQLSGYLDGKLVTIPKENNNE